ncbi:MAG: hypothetical protein LUD83_01800, partial [Clostridiales bacterium]|nr:hypothetical protein [Clostridiales bacterium]
SALSQGAWLVLVVFVLLAFEVSLSANVMVDGIRSVVLWISDKAKKLVQAILHPEDPEDQQDA